MIASGAPAGDPAGFDEVIHQPVRLRIMATLVQRPDDAKGGGLVEFTWLKQLLGLTEGNLGAHLATLEKAGLVRVEKDFVGKRPRTRLAASKAGRRAFAAHVAALEAILRTASDGP